MRRFVILGFLVPLAFSDENRLAIPDVGPDTCNQDRTTLGKWWLFYQFCGISNFILNWSISKRYINHGQPSLLEEPIPELVRYVGEDPYDNPLNPPEDPEEIRGFCGMKVTSPNNYILS